MGDESAKISVFALLAHHAGKFAEFYKKMMQSVFPDEVSALSILDSLNVKTKTAAAKKLKEELTAAVITDTKLAQDLDISATPSFIVGGEVIVGAQMTELEEAVKKAREQLKPSENKD